MEVEKINNILQDIITIENHLNTINMSSYENGNLLFSHKRLRYLKPKKNLDGNLPKPLANQEIEIILKESMNFNKFLTNVGK